MKKFSFFICCLMLLGLITACSDDDNNEDKPDVINGSQDWSAVTFQKLADGSFYYHNSQSPSEWDLQHGVFGHGWKLEKANEIGDDGRMKTNSYYTKVPPEVLFFDNDGNKIFEYHPGENSATYGSHEVYVSNGGWYSFDSYSGSDRWGDTQVIKYNKDENGNEYIIVLGRLYSDGSNQPHYGVKYYTKLDDEKTTDIRNGFEEKVPDDCKFGVKIDAKKYPGVTGDSVFYAPFEFIHFIITDSKGQSNIQNPTFAYYDSITWRRSDNVGGNIKLYSHEGNKTSATFEWSNYFYDKDLIYILVEGWKHGEVVYSANLEMNFRQRDFLCYDWTDKVETPEKIGTGIYNVFIPGERYNLYPPRYDKDGNLYARIFTWSDYGMTANEECEQLYKLLYRYYSLLRKIDSDKADKYHSYFHCLPANDTPVYFANQWGSKVAIVLAKGDDEIGTPEQYYIHAEPSETE